MKKIFAIVVSSFLLFFVFFPASAAFSADVEGKNGLLPLGAPAPDFKLPDVVTGKTVSRDDFSGKKAFLVIFLCRHCPFVQRDKEGIIQMAKDYAGKDIGIVSISSNDPAAAALDSLENLKAMAIEDKFPMPLLFDETQAVGKAYTAVATPDFFLFNKDRKLVYRGQFDDARPSNKVPVTGKDLREAIDAVLQDKAVNPHQKMAIGCSIKWKPGNEPEYFK